MHRNIRALLFILNIFFAAAVHAQSIGDYRSKASGDWDAVNVWQLFDGINWVDTPLPPTNLSGVINILDSVTVSGNDSADEIVVNTGAVLNIQGSFKLFDGPGTDMQCNGKLIIGLGASLNADGSSTVNYTSPVLETDGGFSPVLTFNGTVAQTIHGPSGSGYFGQRITLDNINGLYITGTGINFAGVNFVNGKIFAIGVFLIGEFSSNEFSGQSKNRFIDGNVYCTLFDNSPVTFSLPLGKGNDYLPLKFNIRLKSSQEASFAISIQDGAPPQRTLPASLDKVSAVRYYTITNISNAEIKNASLLLSYTSDDGVTDPANLRIAESNGSEWQDLGGSGNAPVAGVIKSDDFDSVGDFVLANATGGGNILPVDLISFTVSPGKQSPILNWQTANETNNNYFAVERTGGTQNMQWKQLTQISSKGNSAQVQSYFYEDLLPLQGYNFYRLKQVDKDGHFNYSQTVSVYIGNKTNVFVFPNPVKDILNIYGLNAGAQNHLFIVDINGKIIATANTNDAAYVWKIQSLAKGVYHLRIESGNKITMLPFIKD